MNQHQLQEPYIIHTQNNYLNGNLAVKEISKARTGTLQVCVLHVASHNWIEGWQNEEAKSSKTAHNCLRIGVSSKT
jgi:hypothetical protein